MTFQSPSKRVGELAVHVRQPFHLPWTDGRNSLIHLLRPAPSPSSSHLALLFPSPEAEAALESIVELFFGSGEGGTFLGLLPRLRMACQGSFVEGIFVASGIMALTKLLYTVPLSGAVTLLIVLLLTVFKVYEMWQKDIR